MMWQSVDYEANEIDLDQVDEVDVVVAVLCLLARSHTHTHSQRPLQPQRRCYAPLHCSIDPHRSSSLSILPDIDLGQ